MVSGRMQYLACPVSGRLVFFENSACLHCGTELGSCRSRRSWSRSTVRPLRQRRGRALQLARGRHRPALRLVHADPHAPRGRRHRRDGGVRRRRGGQAAAGLPARRPRPAHRRPGVRPAVVGGGAGHHRPRRRRRHHRPGRGRRRAPRGHARAAGRAVPHDARPPAARDRALLLDGAGRARPAARFRELFGDERADYAEALQRHYASPGTRRVGAGVRQHVRHRAPVGGLGRVVRALPAHPRHPADGRGVRHAGARPRAPGPRRRGRTPTGSPRSSRPGCPSPTRSTR